MTDTLLVTGGAGFIGSNFIRQILSQEQVRIVNLDSLTYAGNLESLAEIWRDPRHEFVHGDIGDRALVGDLLERYQPVAIVNFAAESHVDRSIDGPRQFVVTNVLGVVELLSAALDFYRSSSGRIHDRFRFLHVSTDEVYGSAGGSAGGQAGGSERFVETTPYAPNSPYSASKAAADHFVRAFHHTYGLPVLTTNCSNNYGPYQFPEKLIPLMILNALEGKPLPVYGDGGNVRDWLHVDDHCHALRLVLQGGRCGQVYNIGAACEHSNLAVVEAICDTVDRLRPGLAHAPCRSLITFVQDRPGHDRRYAIDASKLRDELGWQPKTDFTAGLSDTVRWYMENPQWVSNISSGVYRRQRLGLGDTKSVHA